MQGSHLPALLERVDKIDCVLQQGIIADEQGGKESLAKVGMRYFQI